MNLRIFQVSVKEITADVFSGWVCAFQTDGN